MEQKLATMKKKLRILLSLFVLVFLIYPSVSQTYDATWQSLRRVQTPQWLQEGKFGIYTHWGIYAVHAYGENTTWYSFAMYLDEEGEARQHFEKKFGELTPEFGYKDLIPMFTAEKFDAEEWAELFAKSGARFAGPVAEHHDGFAMWDSKYSDWNAAKMGPKRDVVGELEQAIKDKDMKFVTAFHHAANWFFFPVSDENYDTGNPEFAGLYGQPHEPEAMRNQEFLDEWYGKIIEVIDNYGPDFIWFDFALDAIPEGYVKDFLAYYYNWAEENGKEVVVTYKGHDQVPGSGIRDLELGQEPNLTFHEWITDNSVDDRGAWGYAEDLTFKTPDRLIDNLVDRVSKNGYLLLNVGPKPDGSIPEGAKEVLLEMGKWLEVNGDAIYGTSPWMIAGEGPTNLGSDPTDIGFNESDIVYTSKDIRFTVKGDDLYATFLDWPGDVAVIQTLKANGLGQADEVLPEWAQTTAVKSLSGTTWDDLWYENEDGEEDEEEAEDENDEGEEYDWRGPYSFEFIDDSNFKVSGGEAGAGMKGTYKQEGEWVYFYIVGDTWSAKYDGNQLMLGDNFGPEGYPGFYREEIKRISMLGDDQDLEWAMTRRGLMIKTPERKGEHAFVFKIERHHRPVLNK